MSCLSMFPGAVGKAELQQGNRRPATLMVHGHSHSIRKPARKPVIVYVVSPEIIHVHASQFMSLVQRLTGFQSTSTSTTTNPHPTISHGDVKPPEEAVAEYAGAMSPQGPHAAPRPSSSDDVGVRRGTALVVVPERGGSFLHGGGGYLMLGRTSPSSLRSSARVLPSPAQYVEVSCQLLVKNTSIV